MDFDTLKRNYEGTDFDALRVAYDGPGPVKVDEQLLQSHSGVDQYSAMKAVDKPQAIFPKTMLALSAGFDEALKYPLAVAKKYYTDDQPGPSPHEIESLVKDAVSYWKKQIPDEDVRWYKVAWSDNDVPGQVASVGKLKLYRSDIQARDMTEGSARFAGFAVPAAGAMKAAAPIEKALEPFAREGFRKVAKGMVAGSLMGEGDPHKTAEQAAMFGLFEVVPAIAKAVRSSIRKRKILREWKKVPNEMKVPVVQSLEEVLNRNPDLTEAEVVKKSIAMFREAQKRRATGENVAEKSVEEPGIWGDDEIWKAAKQEDVQAARQDQPAIRQETPVGLPAPQPKPPEQSARADTGRTSALPPPPQGKQDELFDRLRQRYEQNTIDDAITGPAPTARELVEANSEHERNRLIARVFGMTEDELGYVLDSDHWDMLPAGEKYDFADEYLADLSHAARERNLQDVKEILNRVRSRILPEDDFHGARDTGKKDTVPDIAALENDPEVKKIADHDGNLKQVSEEELTEQRKLQSKEPDPYHEDMVFSSPEFTKWFGDFIDSPDSASKVVDEEGYPLTVYHWTDSPGFEEFRPNNGMIWFSESPDEFAPSSLFADRGYGVYPVYLRVVNPLDLTDAYGEYTLDEWRKILSESGVNVDNLKFDSALQDNEEYHWGYLMSNDDIQLNDDSNLASVIAESGFDGIHAPPENLATGVNNWVVFSPSQIKSIYNRGSFSRTSDNIMKEPESHYSTGDYSDDPIVMELPEVVELARAILGKDPSLVKSFRKESARGSFSPGQIKLLRDLAKDPDQAIKTLAHEIGHAVDFADETLARGNILGHIAALKRYLKRYLAEKPGSRGPLTQAEIAELKREARRIAKNEVEDVPGIDPDAVLDFLRGVSTDKLPQDVRNYISMATGPEKKSIVKQAMKGLAPEELAHFNETGKVTVDVDAKFRELLKAEIERRKLWDKYEITEELKRHSAQWRPWERGADPAYDKYRDKPSELYADAVSALVTNPEALEKTAPKFYEAFFNYMEKRPEFKKTWESIQERLHAGPGAVSRARIERSRQDFAKDAEMRRQAYDKAEAERKANTESVKDTIARGLSSKYRPIENAISEVRKAGGGSKAADELERLIIKRPYTPSEIDAYAYDYKKWVDRVKEEGFTLDDLGVVGKRLHIQHNRKDIFSPGGLTEKTAKDDLAVLAQEWGEAKYNKALELLQEYRDLREKYIIPLVEESGIATDKLLDAMKSRKHYLRVSVSKFVNRDPGTGNFGFFRQLGTFGAQGNPLVATFLDDVKTIYAARENIYRKAAINVLRETGAVREAPLRYSKDRKTMVPDERKKRPNEEVVTYRDNGKIKYFFADKDLAKLLRNDPHKATRIAQIWDAVAQVFRELFVSSNYRWMLRNIPRDFAETIFRNPREIGVKGIAKLLKEYWDAAPDVWREAWKGERHTEIQDMMRRRSLPSNRIWTGLDETPSNEVERILSRYNFYKVPGTKHGLYDKYLKKFWNSQTAEQIANAIENFIRAAWDKKERAGRFSDLWGKVAGRRFLRKYTDLDPETIDIKVIEDIGTPNFKRQGDWQQVTNNLFIFSNIGKEGLRSEFRAAKGSPWHYAAAVAALTVTPKVTLYMMENGKLGKDMQRLVRGIPKYYKDHYFVIPLFTDERGKSHFLAFPTGFNQQVIGAMFSKAIRGEFAGKDGVVAEASGLSPYSVHPAIGTVAALAGYYLLGINPIDLYTKRNVISKRNFEAGGIDAASDLFRDAWRSLGGRLLYDPPGKYESKRMSKTEKALRTFPGSVIGTFYHISDRGISEWIEDQLKDERKRRTKASIEKSRLLRETAKDRDRALIVADILKRTGNSAEAKTLLRDMALIWGDQWAKAIALARNKEERQFIMELMLKENGE